MFVRKTIVFLALFSGFNSAYASVCENVIDAEVKKYTANGKCDNAVCLNRGGHPTAMSQI